MDLLYQQFIFCTEGILLRMGILQYPNVFDYWGRHTRIAQIADKMSRDRFWFLLRHLHFRDNNSVTQEEKSRNRLWKMTVWFDKVHRQLARYKPTQYVSVDEQMIAFKGICTY